MERIWGEVNLSPQPTVINWPGLNDKEKTELIPTLTSTDNWILLTHPLGAKNKSQPPLAESPGPKANAAGIRAGGVRARMN